MSLEISIQELPGYLRVEVSGTRTTGSEKQEAVKLFSRVAEACRASGMDRILVISRATGRIPTLEGYEVAGHSEEFGWSRDYKLALVDLIQCQGIRQRKGSGNLVAGFATLKKSRR